MENTILDQDQDLGAGKINVLSNQAFGFLKEVKMWSKFLSIIGFVMIGLLVVIAIGAGTILANLGGGAGAAPAGLLTVIYLLIALLYFFPTYYLFQFSNNMGKAYKTNSSSYVTEAFKNLKSSFKFVGIMTLIFVIIYAGILLIAGIGGLFSLFR